MVVGILKSQTKKLGKLGFNGGMMIDINKSIKAKVFDADTNYHETAILEVEVQAIILPHPPYTQQPEIIYNGGRSSTFEFLPQD